MMRSIRNKTNNSLLYQDDDEVEHEKTRQATHCFVRTMMRWSRSNPKDSNTPPIVNSCTVS